MPHGHNKRTRRNYHREDLYRTEYAEINQEDIDFLYTFLGCLVLSAVVSGITSYLAL